MKNLLIITGLLFLFICSGPSIVTAGGKGSYTTPEQLQSRIDYNQRIIWDLENKYRTKNCSRMHPRDKSRYLKAQRDLRNAINEYNNLIRQRQYKQRGYYPKY